VSDNRDAVVRKVWTLRLRQRFAMSGLRGLWELLNQVREQRKDAAYELEKHVEGTKYVRFRAAYEKETHERRVASMTAAVELIDRVLIPDLESMIAERTEQSQGDGLAADKMIQHLKSELTSWGIEHVI
jgi:hypothetical protein